MLELAKTYGVTRVGLPRIGARLGGLDWEDVKSVIKRICEPSDIEVIVFRGIFKIVISVLNARVQPGLCSSSIEYQFFKAVRSVFQY